MSKAKIEQLLAETFQPSFLQVIDDSHKHAGHAGAREGGHFAVDIKAQAFAGKSPLERHRMVYAALEPIKRSIHALSIKAGV